MYSRRDIFKLFSILSLSFFFMISSCSTPSEDKDLPSKQVSKTTQAEKTKVKTPAPETPKPAAPKPASEPEAAALKPEPAKPEVPEPVPTKPAKESSFIDVITMDNPAYSKHKKSIVLFTHKKHVKEYKIDCGACHHDKTGVPLTGLKENDAVENCISCHTKPGQAPKPKDKKKLSIKEKLEYHAEAIHENCIKCHKEYNKKNDTKAAPASCSKCHPKKE